MSETVYKQLVTKLEHLKDDKGHGYVLITTHRKDGAEKQKKVYDWDLQKEFAAPGWYELRYDDDTHYLIGAHFIGTGEEGSAPPIVIGSTGAPIPSKSLTNNLQGHQNLKDREIRGAVILKACSEYLAAVTSIRQAELEGAEFAVKAQHAFKVFQNLLESYVNSKPADFESVPF